MERHVGQGGMGSVYLATDERFHSTVAIKEALFADDTYRKAFEREARLLNSLKHSALPKVTDHFVEENGQYIVMEYIGGDDLFEKMRKAVRPFQVEDVLKWSGQLLDALSYLHEQGIVHRDIKPQNLKLTKQGNIILLDFGLAKGNPTDANYQTAAQSIFGYSRNYASLEQIQGTGTDPRSDFYSFAATIYHLMTARVPADALTRVMKVLNENSDPLEPAGQFNPEITQEVSDALDECLALKADSRPGTVEEIRSLLFRETKTKFIPVPGRETAGGGGEDLFAGETRLADESGGTPRSGQSEAKTEVFDSSEPDSAQTRIANRETDVNSGPGKTVGKRNPWFWGIPATAGIVLAILGGVSAMVFLWPPSDPVSPSGPEIKTEGSAEQVPLSKESELQGTSELTGAVNTDGKAGESTSSTTETAAKQDVKGKKETPKAAAGKDKVKTVTDFSTGSEKVRITDSSVEAGGVRITPGKIETKSADPFPQKPPADLPLPREQFEKLTPKQKLRLIQALERERRLRNSRLPALRGAPTNQPPPPF